VKNKLHVTSKDEMLPKKLKGVDSVKLGSSPMIEPLRGGILGEAYAEKSEK